MPAASHRRVDWIRANNAAATFLSDFEQCLEEANVRFDVSLWHDVINNIRRATNGWTASHSYHLGLGLLLRHRDDLVRLWSEEYWNEARDQLIHAINLTQGSDE